MPIRGEKVLEAVKGTTGLTTYVSGTPIAPSAGALAIYMDLATADQHRNVETASRIKELVDRARERNFVDILGGVTGYFFMPIGGGKRNIQFTTVVTNLVVGTIGIGGHADVSTGNLGSTIIYSCFKDIADFMNEFITP